MLILKAKYIPSINKSPVELSKLARKFRTNLPTMIDLNQNKSNETEIETLVDKHQKVTHTGKELPKLDVGIPVLYDKNHRFYKDKMSYLGKRHCQRIEKIQVKYHILTDEDRMITKSRHGT